MSLSKGVLITTIVMTVILIVVSQQPSTQEITEQTNLRLTSDAKIALDRPAVSGLRATGSYSGQGNAQVWAVLDKGKRLALDTRNMDKLALSSEKSFKKLCMESCEFSPSDVKELQIEIEGGELILEQLHYTKSQNSIGLAVCPTCKRVASSRGEPDHSLLVLVLMLALTILGSHTLSHFCEHKKARIALLFIFGAAFITLALMFGITISMPTSALAVTARRSASILAATGVLTVFGIIAYELTLRKKEIHRYEGDRWD